MGGGISQIIDRKTDGIDAGDEEVGPPCLGKRCATIRVPVESASLLRLCDFNERTLHDPPPLVLSGHRRHLHRDFVGQLAAGGVRSTVHVMHPLGSLPCNKLSGGGRQWPRARRYDRSKSRTARAVANNTVLRSR